MKLDVEELFIMFKKRFAIPNLIIFIGILYLLGKIISIWFSTPKEIEIKLADINPAKESSFVLKGRNISLSDYEIIPKKNLFRESRTEWVPPQAPPPPKPKPPPPKPSSPPEVTVSGIVFGSELGRRVILEGKYFVPGEKEGKVIKKKGYKLNDRIGQYQIVEIGLNEVVLVDPGGSSFTFYVKKSLANRKDVLNKPRKLKGKNLIGTAVKKLEPPEKPVFHVSGSTRSTKSKPRQHVSGN